MIDDFTRGMVVGMYSVIKNYTQVAKHYKLSRLTVKRIVEQNSASQPRKSRHTSPNVVKRRQVLRKLAQQTKKRGHRTFPLYGSAAKLRRGLMKTTGELLSRRHVARELCTMGFKSYVRPKCPTRKPHDLRIRKLFAKKHCNQNKRHIIFTDETWLTCNEETSRTQYCRTKAQVLPLEIKSRYNVPSIQIWAAVGWNYKSDLVFFPTNKRDEDGKPKCWTLNSEQYVRRCLSTISTKLQSGFVLQQDNARAHISGHTKTYLSRKGIQFLDDWPANSPDLNSIEFVWHDLKRAIGEKCPLTLEELVETAKQEWKNLSQDAINRHVDAFHAKLKKVARSH